MLCPNIIAVIVSHKCGFCQALEQPLSIIQRNHPRLKIKRYDITDPKTLSLVMYRLGGKLNGVPGFYCEKNDKFYSIPWKFNRFDQLDYLRAANLALP